MANKRFPADMADFTATADRVLVVKADGTVGYLNLDAKYLKLAGGSITGILKILRTTAAQYTQIDSEAGATTILSKSMVNATFAQMLFSQGNNVGDREMARFDGNGNFVIGDIATNNKLKVVSLANTSYAAAFLYGENWGTLIGTNDTSALRYVLNVMSGVSQSGSGGTSLFYVRADGNIGIKNTSPSRDLEIGNPTLNASPFIKITRSTGNMLIGVNQNENAIYSRTETDAAKPFKLIVGSTDALTIAANTNATFAGTVTCTTLNQTSTRETKNVQGEFEDDALSIIKNLILHKFTYKNFEQVLKTPEVIDEEGKVTTPAEFERVELPAGPDDQLNVGLLYDEVESNPYISTGNGSIQVNNLLFMALKAIQQLQAKNTELTQRIEALEG